MYQALSLNIPTGAHLEALSEWHSHGTGKKSKRYTHLPAEGDDGHLVAHADPLVDRPEEGVANPVPALLDKRNWLLASRLVPFDLGLLPNINRADSILPRKKQVITVSIYV